MNSALGRLFSWISILCAVVSACAQAVSSPPDPYKLTVDRLQSIATISLTSCSIHAADLPHGEDPALNLPVDTAGWQQVKIHEEWNGSRWLRQTFEVPAELNRYQLKGASIALDLHVSSGDAIQVSVFAHGSMVARTDEDGQLPITLIENAESGQKIVIAVRVVDSGGEGCCDGDASRLEHAELRIQPTPDRPDPALLRLQILSAQTLIAAYAEGKGERQQQLDTAVKAINLAALDRGDQQAFDDSLRDAQSKLEILRPYMKQFRVAAVGNSHIDMAWLWP